MHGEPNIIHLNAAGAARPAPGVVSAVGRYLREEAERGGYEMEASTVAVVDGLRAAIAEVVRCDPGEVGLAPSATDAYQRIVSSVSIEAGQRIVTTSAEFTSNWLTLVSLARDVGGTVVAVEVTGNDHDADIAALEEALDDDVALVSLTHIASDNGALLPVAQLASAARRHGAFVVADVAQSIGQVPIDWAAMACDAIIGTGRKYLRGPRGTAFFVIGKSAALIEPRLVDGVAIRTWMSPLNFELHEGPRRFQTRERSLALQVGLAAAVRHALAVGIDVVQRHVGRVADVAARALDDVVGLTRYERHTETGLVTFNLDGVDAATVASLIRDDGISVWCCPRGLSRFVHQEESVVRASFHRYNSQQDALAFADSVRRIARRR